MKNCKRCYQPILETETFVNADVHDLCGDEEKRRLDNNRCSCCNDPKETYEIRCNKCIETNNRIYKNYPK